MTAPPEPSETRLAPAVPHRRGFGWWRWLVGSSVVLVLPAALLVALTWSFATQRGTAWLLAQLNTMEVEQMQGSLLNGFSAKRITVRLPSGPNDRVVIDAPQASALSLSPSASPQAWLRIRLESMSAERVSVQIAPSGKPPSLPADLQLPFELEVNDARLGRLELPGLEASPMRELRGRFHLGAERGTLHRGENLALALGPLQLRGKAQLGSDSRLPLQAQLDATQANDANAPATELPPWARALRQDWRAHIEANGPLARFAATLALRAQGQSLDAQADVAPLEAWPLPRLDARTERLDLSALLTQAPSTALSGDIHITPAAGQPAILSARAQMNNERPGRWDQRHLPVRSFSVELRAQPGAASRFEIVEAQASLAGEGRDAGTLRGQGEWNAGAFKVQATLNKAQPGLLDPRLPAMTISGPFKLDGKLGTSAPLFDLQAELDGHLNTDTARAVQVRVAASGTADRIEVRELQAKAGPALFTLAGSAQRAATSAPWHVVGKARLNDFDPLPWFPGESQSAWRRGPHRFNGDADFALDVPRLDERPKDLDQWLDTLAGLNGQARVALRNSVLAGVALQGEASLQSQPATPARLTARIDAAGNSANVQGQWTRGGRADEWNLDVKAPQLGRLGPLFALGAVPARWAAPAGALDASTRLEGRWPTLRAQGQAKAQGLRLAEGSVSTGEARWSYQGRSESGDAPFDVHIGLIDARWAQQQAGSVTLDLKGTPNAQTLDLRAVLNGAPPAWAESLLAPRVADARTADVRTADARPADARPAESNGRSQTRVQLEARGGFESSGSALPTHWRGSVQTFEVLNGAGETAPLARVRDVALEVHTGDAQHPPAVTLQPGRGEVLGVALRWERVFWQGAGAGGAAQLDVQAELEPLAVAPLLARAQPSFGWRGDLRMGGKIIVRSAPSVLVDVVIERIGGDLSVTDETGTQALQLTDLRIALNAKDGAWSLTQAFAGKTLGEAAGAVTAQVSPQRQWPGADTPIQGVLEARVANLGTWGAWVPPGWRLAGALRTSATIGGRVGAPEYTGEMRGTGIGVRNIVQGVNVTDGDIAINLRGTNARIERFEAKAGNGSVRLEGGASLGEAPKAQLRVVADKFQLLGRVDRRIVASGSAQMQIDAASLHLDGQFTVDEGLIDFTRGDAPALSDDVRVTARPGVPEKPVDTAASRAAARNVTMDLKVALGNNLRVRGRGLDTLLRGDLRLSTPANRLALNGTVSTAQGTYAAYGQKLSIDRGELVFAGVAENPRLDIVATRPNLEQIVGVAVTGTALNPRVRLFSEPEMADIDKLSWLVLGRASDGLGRTDMALLQRAAIGLLAGEGTGPTDQLINAVGLDEVSFRQTEGEVRETVVSLGKQLSRRWYVGYERGLNATTGNWQLIYRIAQRLTLRAQSGLDNSLDAIWTWRWQ